MIQALKDKLWTICRSADLAGTDYGRECDGGATGNENDQIFLLFHFVVVQSSLMHKRAGGILKWTAKTLCSKRGDANAISKFSFNGNLRVYQGFGLPRLPRQVLAGSSQCCMWRSP